MFISLQTMHNISPSQFFAFYRKRRKTLNTFLILVFSVLVPTFILFFHFFFSIVARLKLVTYQPIIPISKFQHIIASHAILLQPHVISSTFKFILSSLFTLLLHFFPISYRSLSLSLSLSLTVSH